jgi:hypothetical protein
MLLFALLFLLTSSDPPVDPVADPPAEPPAEPVADPPEVPVPDAPVDPIADPPADPAADPVADPAAAPPADGVADPAADPAGDPAAAGAGDDYPDYDSADNHWDDDHYPHDDYHDYDGEYSGDYDHDYYDHEYYDHHRYSRPTRDPNASYVPCPNPRAVRDEYNYCACLPEYPFGSGEDENGCWKCDETCHAQATCVSPGRCQCLDNYEGDGVSRCDAIVPQLVALSPTTGYSDAGTWVHISFIHTAKNWEWQKNSAVCKFGSYAVSAVNVTDSTLECRAPPHHPAIVDVAISMDGNAWSKEKFTFVYRTQFNVLSILPIVLLYAAVILAIATVIWKLIGRRAEKEAAEEEQQAFLTRRKKSKGVGFAKAKMKKRMGP